MHKINARLSFSSAVVILGMVMFTQDIYVQHMFHTSRRVALMQPNSRLAIPASWQVLQNQGKLNNNQLTAGGGSRAATSVVHCFQSWLGVDCADSHQALISPGELWSAHRMLFDQLLAALSSDDTQLLDCLGETLAMLFGDFPASLPQDQASGGCDECQQCALLCISGSLLRRTSMVLANCAPVCNHVRKDASSACDLGSGKASAGPETEEAALRAAARGILHHTARVTSPVGEAFCRAAAEIATVLTEVCTEGFAGRFAEVL